MRHILDALYVKLKRSFVKMSTELQTTLVAQLNLAYEHCSSGRATEH